MNYLSSPRTSIVYIMDDIKLTLKLLNENCGKLLSSLRMSLPHCKAVT